MAAKAKLTAGDKAILRNMVGRFHVGTPDEEVVSEILSTLRTPPSPAQERALREFVIKEHHRNQGLYARVQRGRF